MCVGQLMLPSTLTPSERQAVVEPVSMLHTFSRQVDPPQHSSLQGFPIVHQRVLKAAEVLDELCKQGLVDVNDLASRFTAGKFF